jgi:uncharacterized membrane protein YcaP (DUF421 family)
MNAFDLVVTVAFGSTLATAILSPTVVVADAVAGFFMLVALQYAVAWMSVRARWFRRVVKSRPTLLFHRGEFLYDDMRRERVVRDEVIAAMRTAGFGGRDEVAAVVLETDGSMSVLGRAPASDASTIAHMGGEDADPRGRDVPGR